MTTQPEALRLADALEASVVYGYDDTAAAAELRRLHSVNANLLWTSKRLVAERTSGLASKEAWDAVRDAIARAEEVKPPRIEGYNTNRDQPTEGIAQRCAANIRARSNT